MNGPFPYVETFLWFLFASLFIFAASAVVYGVARDKALCRDAAIVAGSCSATMMAISLLGLAIAAMAGL